MNSIRKRQILGCAEELHGLRDEIYDLISQEQFYIDSMPESLQNGAKYEASEGYIASLEQAAKTLNRAIEQLEDIF